MKLSKFIKEQCANYIRNECIGAWGTRRFNDTYKCVPLEKEPKPCGYFEGVVLPWAIKLGCHEELIDDYSKIDFGVVKRTQKVRQIEAKKPKMGKKRAEKYAKLSTR